MAITLFKFGNADFKNLIRAETYKVTPASRQDLNAYRDANGLLHRNALKHTATQVEFNTIPMKQAQMTKLMKAIKDSYVNFNERDSKNCSYYDPELGTMSSGHHMYLSSNLAFQIYGTYNDEIFYKECTFKFVEY